MDRDFEDEAMVIRSLANDVMRECACQNVKTQMHLCVYLIDLKLLQISKSVSAVATDETLAQSLIDKCVSDLKQDHPWMKTLKLQIFWREKYRSKDEIKRFHHETVFNNALPIMTEVVNGSLIKTVDKESLYKTIVLFIIMFAGLGSPTQQIVIKETQAALHSIFKNTEIDNFLSLNKPTKEQQLIEFARLVTGIRLFNKDCKKGGEGIEDLPLILTQGVRATQERLINFKDQLDNRIDRLVKALSQVYRLDDFDESVEPASKISLPAGFRKDDMEDIKTAHIYCRQLEICLKDLLRDVHESSLNIEELVERLQGALLQVHEVVRYRVAISTAQVFPLFLKLSNIWVEMQEEVDILSEINNTFVDLSLFASLPLPTPLELALCPSPDVSFLSDVSDIKDDSSMYHSGVQICSFSTLSSLEYLQYEGFCAWTLACTEGLLIKGNVSIGVLCFGNRFYSFSSAEAANKWASDPGYHIAAVLNVAKMKPELIRLLNLHADLEAFGEKESTLQDEQNLTKENAEVQTDLHPVDSYINRDYTFSEWELKRRALKLATLTRFLTKSQQTVQLSHFRKEIGIQVKSDKKPLSRRSG